jgi:hypothetical protein
VAGKALKIRRQKLLQDTDLYKARRYKKKKETIGYLQQVG